MTGKDRLVTFAKVRAKQKSKNVFTNIASKKFWWSTIGFVCKYGHGKRHAKTVEKPTACKDAMGRLRVGAAHRNREKHRDRAAALIEAGVDVLVVDTALRYILRTCWNSCVGSATIFPDVENHRWQHATSEAAKALIEVGVNAIKVGIGPGSICTTRIVTGVGVLSDHRDS